MDLTVYLFMQAIIVKQLTLLHLLKALGLLPVLQ